MGDLIVFQNLIEQLQSPDNDTRSQAEIRHMATILARRLLVKDYENAFEKLPQETQNLVKQQLGMAIMNEADRLMRRKLCELVAELVRMQIDVEGQSKWPEFVPFLIQLSQSPNVELCEAACQIFASVPNVFANQQAANIGIIGQMLGRAISDLQAGRHELRALGVKALAAFIAQEASEQSVLQALRELVPHALQAITTSLQEESSDDTMLKALVEIADAAPKYLRPHLASVLEVCYKTLCNTELDESQRHLSLETIVLLAENLPSAVRRTSPQLVQSLISTLLALMTEVDDQSETEQEWITADTEQDDDETCTAVTAEIAIDRLAVALGGQPVLSVIIQTVPGMLANTTNWKHRYAGLMAIGACSEGSAKPMENMLASILEAVLPLLKDQQPRVRYAACNTLGQMSNDFAPKLAKDFHHLILPALVASMDEDPVPRVQSNAGAALVNFCENLPQHILLTYLDGLVGKLESTINTKLRELVEKGKTLVITQLITTLASVADTAEKKFSIYYGRFMPLLRYLMEHVANRPDLNMLRSKTVECISLIGLAVGKEQFADDIKAVMQMLIASQPQSQVDSSNQAAAAADDDPYAGYLVTAWTRICKLLGREFSAYLPMIMPQVLRMASIKPEVHVLDNQEVEQFDQEIDWQLVKMGEDRNYAIHTGGLEDKATACQMLVCLVKEMKELFLPFCQQVLDLLLPLMEFYFNDEVRTAASECMPYLLTSLKLTRQPALLNAAWTRIFPALLQAISNEPERALVGDHLGALACCIEVVGSPGLTEQLLTQIRDLLVTLFHEHFENGDERLTKRNDEDYDEFEEERLMSEKDEDEIVLSKMSEVVHSVFAVLGTNALMFFQQLIVFCVRLLEPQRPWSDLRWGICFWDDVIEFAGPQSWQFHEFFLPILVKSIEHPQPDVRQAALYGVGIAAMMGGPDYSGVLQSLVPPIVQQIEAAESRSSDNNQSTENAISAITKMMKYRSDCLPASLFGGASQSDVLTSLIPRWLQWLPVWEDGEEVAHVYAYLCDLVEANSPSLLGNDNANLPRIVQSIAQAMALGGLELDEEAEQEEKEVQAAGDSVGLANGGTGVKPVKSALALADTYRRCVAILRQIQSNQPLVEACVRHLTEDQQKAISTALS